MEFDVFLTDRPGERDEAGSSPPRSPDHRSLVHAGSVVVGVVAELDVLAFEHPRQGWRKAATGDVAYDGPHGRVFSRTADGWCAVTSKPFQEALARRVARLRRAHFTALREP
jgi:hypothetical protein